ncbi:SPJ_0845 family protein [Schleiferilactobacillus shenzhenensis]|nr:SPJ_0845 family protein [Schleiferilactobacillus shenzhenensis]
MGLTVKRENTLTSMFDSFATIPEDLKKKIDLKDGDEKKDDKKQKPSKDEKKK